MKTVSLVDIIAPFYDRFLHVALPIREREPARDRGWRYTNSVVINLAQKLVAGLGMCVRVRRGEKGLTF